MNSRFSTCKFLGLLLAAGLVSGQAMAQSSVEAEAKATILQPIVITNERGMDFGRLFSASTEETVTLSTRGNRTTSNDYLLLAGGDSQHSAEFEITGVKGAEFSVTLPSAGVTLESGSNEMTVNAFTSSFDEGDEISNDGTRKLWVGGTLTVGGAQPAGDYKGDFTVTVAYN